jgi:malonate-semialdehyde dehydrogenase (acetylating)/methylmalonate-semialdehyde dehydrogenase
VICEDAPAGSVAAVVGAAFGAAGQRCMALSRVVLVGGARDRLPEIVAASRALVVGPGAAPGVDVPPLASRGAADRVLSLVAAAAAEGAVVALDGRGASVAGFPDGNWVGPTVLEVAPDMAIYDTEVFGPVLQVLTAATIDDAIALLNADPYGNGASVFTASGATARAFKSRVDVGQIGVNIPIPVPLPMFSFTGGGASFLGDLNFYGKAGVAFFTQWKTVTEAWHADGPAAPLAMPTPGAEE